jgi:hypothetical protein
LRAQLPTAHKSGWSQALPESGKRHVPATVKTIDAGVLSVGCLE